MAKPKLRMPKGRAPGEPPQKIEQLRALMASGDWRAALKLAASFPQLGAEKAAITRGWEAIVRPAFYEGRNRDPAALVEAGKAALVRRYSASNIRTAEGERTS